MSDQVVTNQILKSKIYGDIKVEPSQIYEFDQGLIGLTDLSKFALLPIDDSELFILQSFEDEFGFMLIPAGLTENEVSFHITEDIIEQLGIASNDDVITMFVLRFIDDVPHINKRAPILIVPKTQKGCQYIISDDNYSFCEKLVIKD